MLSMLRFQALASNLFVHENVKQFPRGFLENVAAFFLLYLYTHINVY